MKTTRLLFLLFLLFSLYCLPLQNAWAEKPHPPDIKARCPVCGMFVAPYPNWLTGVSFADGHREYFDGPKDLFRYILSSGSQAEGRGAEDLREVWVTEYYSVRPVLATEVYFISGSDIKGPMGDEMVPVKKLEQARSFLLDHGGKKIFRFDGQALIEVDGR